MLQGPASRRLLSFERHTAWQRPGAFVAHSVEVVGVIETSAKVRSHHVLQREAGELTEGPVDIEDRAIRTEDGDGGLVFNQSAGKIRTTN